MESRTVNPRTLNLNLPIVEHHKGGGPITETVGSNKMAAYSMVAPLWRTISGSLQR